MNQTWTKIKRSYVACESMLARISRSWLGKQAASWSGRVLLTTAVADHLGLSQEVSHHDHDNHCLTQYYDRYHSVLSLPLIDLSKVCRTRGKHYSCAALVAPLCVVHENQKAFDT